jgi:NAD dependent epimerase/dehydratase
MKWEGKSVLITGGTGFIGSHLAERMVELGARTRVLALYNSDGTAGWLDSSPFRSDIEIVFGDVTDPETLREPAKGIDTIFHLAALIAIPYSYIAPRSYIRTNIEGTLNVLQAGRDADVRRIVHTSTSETYGTAQTVPITEDHPLQGQSPYAASKIGADKMVEAFHRSFEVPVTTVRPFNTYGPRQSARAVLPTIITQALTQDRIKLGSLHPTRDLNHVEDTAEGFVKASESDRALGMTVNLATGKEISVGDLARSILSILDRDLPIVSDDVRVRPVASEVERLCGSNELARTLIDWKPSVSLRKGLQNTIEWFSEHHDLYRPTEYTV